ncbi:uncharacterized protein METZ01_LOCUS303769 [marine metagenome]|uniref:Uncharacterized protein n=1 Tax=marine metagenome TaxID=408172 RepID=A0A382MS04_9ZZZZ
MGEVVVPVVAQRLARVRDQRAGQFRARLVR